MYVLVKWVRGFFYIDKELFEELYILIIIFGSSKNLVLGFFECLIVVIGVKVKYILIFLVSFGIVENVIKFVREEIC